MSLSASLADCPLFEGIGSDQLEEMFGCFGARRLSFRRGDTIMSEGAPARDVGIMLRGRAQVIRTDYYGNRSIMMNIEGGQLFGESFACSKVEAMPVSVVAVEDCQVILIECRRILTVCSSACTFHSRLILNLLQIVADKNLAMNQKAMITSKRTTREKLMAYLLLMAKQAGSARFSVPFDRQGLAEYLEVDRSGLSSELSKLKKEGILDFYKSDFCLKRAIEG